MVGFRFKWTGRETLGMTVREYGELRKRTWTAVGVYWAKTFLPRHFKKNAHGRYGYAPRGQKYLERKKRMAERGKAEKGGAVDLVLSGNLEQRIKDHVLIRPYPSRLTFTMIGPKYLTMTPKGSNPNMAKEIFATTAKEKEMILKRMQRVSDAILKQIQKRGYKTKTL